MSRMIAAAMTMATLAGAAMVVTPGAVAGTESGVSVSPPAYVKALLSLRHPAGLRHFVRRVSDPRSPRYRDYRTVEQMVRRFGARRRDRRATLGWLADHGLRGEVGPTGTYVLARLPEPMARQVFQPVAGFPDARRLFRAGSNAAPRRVPTALREHVAELTLLSTRPGAFTTSVEVGGGEDAAPAQDEGSQRPRTGTAAGCAEGQTAGRAPPRSGFTPNQYLEAYGHRELHERGFRGEGMRVAFVEIDGVRRSDIKTFGQCFGISIPRMRITPVGQKSLLPPGGETTLDLSVISATAPALRGIEVYEGPSSLASVLETTAAALGPRGRHPNVISISLGSCEPASSQRRVWRTMNEVFAVAAGAGITTLVAAGDTGSSACRFGATPAEASALALRAASFPATSPYVTAVGGTNLVLDADNEIANQLVWNDSPAFFGGGGGGVSVLFRRPWWQAGVRIKPGSQGSRTVPDIAGLADITPGYALYCTAQECEDFPHQVPGWVSVGGTSAATPLFAGGIALADQHARRHGQAPLGLINPLLYRIGKRKAYHRVFRDLRTGDNDLGEMIPAEAGGGQPLGCCTAREGYDMASGLGSPDLVELVKAARRAR